MSRRPMYRCSRAQMSFALVAVVLLLLVSASAVLNAAMDQRERERAVSASVLAEMDAICHQVAQELRISLYQVALGCISISESKDEAALATDFADDVSSGPSRQFPQVRGQYSVQANLSTSCLAFQRSPLRESYPELARSDGAAQMPVSFIVCGYITVNVSCADSFRESEFPLDDGIPVPVPYARDRAGALSARMDGSNSELELMVRAMLGALVQLRVLRGAAGAAGEQSCEEALTEVDVRNAIALAYMLEQARLLAAATDPGFLPEAQPLLRSLLAESREVDPAKLFISIYDGGIIDLRKVLAQSLYASAEVIALRWLDYFHIIDLLSLGEKALDGAGIVMAEIIEACLGIDLAEARMRSWLNAAISERGMNESQVRLFHDDAEDKVVRLDQEVELLMENGTFERLLVQGRFPVDLPTVDILDRDFLSSFYKEYKWGANELAASVVQMIRALALEIAARAAVPTVEACPDPLDGHDIWTEVCRIVEDALRASGDWLSPILSSQRPTMSDPMAAAFLKALTSRAELLFERNDSIDLGMDRLSHQALESLWQQGCAVSREEYNDARMKQCLAWEGDALEEMCRGYDADIKARLAELDGILGSKEAEGREFVLALIQMAAGAVAAIPGVEALMEGSIMQMLRSVASAASIRASNSTFSTPSANCSTRPAAVASSDRTWVDQLDVMVYSPRDSQANTYDTDPLKLEWTPYTSVWTVRVSGTARFAVTCDGDWVSLAGGSATCSAEARLDMRMSIAAESGWPLQGVAYQSTRSLLGDAYDLWQKALRHLGEAFNWISGAAGKVVAFMKGIIQRLVSFSAQTVQGLMDILVKAVDGLYGIIGGVAAQSAGKVIEGLASMLGSRNDTVNLLGLEVGFAVLPDDLSNSGWKTIVALSLAMPLTGSRLCVTLRLVSSAGSYHFLGNCTLSSRGWGVQVSADPLMTLMGSALTVRGYVSDKAFEVILPEACRDSVAELRLSSIPGVGTVISNIPLPIPGLKGSFDAGLFIRSSRTNTGSLMINEFEQNPAGADADNEWVEVLNPSDHVISAAGYQFQTQHGRQALEALGSAALQPHSRQVYVLHGQCLDNDGEAQFPRMESLSLIGPDGRVVDRTPWAQDTKDDSRTWQREYDGAGRWVFTESTRNKANGGLLGQALGSDSVMRLIDNISSGILLNRSQDPIGGVRDTLLDSIARLTAGVRGGTVLEAGVFLEVGVSAIAGTASAVLRISLSVSGNLMRTLLQWVERVIDQLLGRFSTEGLSVPIEATDLMEQSWVRGGLAVQAGMPSFLGIKVGQVRLVFEVGCNLATIARALGHDIGEGRIEGSCRVSSLSSTALPSALRSSGPTSDVYVFRFALWDR